MTESRETQNGFPSDAQPGQGFRALTDRWTRQRVETIIALLHEGDMNKLGAYLDTEVPSVPHSTDPEGLLDLKGLHFDALPYRVDLGRVRFEKLNLWSSNFRDVSLKDATFKDCFLGLSTFVDAYMRGVTITDCDIHGGKFKRAHMHKMKFVSTRLRYCSWNDCEIDISAFPDELEEEKQGRFAFARDVYKALRLDLNAAGDTTSASWAAYKQQRMDRRATSSQRRYLRWTLSWILDVLWGYGEKPFRLFIFSVVFCVIWAFGYFAAGINVGGTCTSALNAAHWWEHFVRCIYFSFVTFTTLGYGELSPCTNLGRVLSVIQAFSGIFIMGLFVSANVRKLSGG